MTIRTRIAINNLNKILEEVPQLEENSVYYKTCPLEWNKLD